jgi:hypothetical protein
MAPASVGHRRFSEWCPWMSLLEICQWIESTPSSTALRESLIVFPILETTHVLGLAFSVGTIFWFDLRLWGVGLRRYGISEMFGYVRPWMLAGFALMMITGAALFWSHAVQAYNSWYFLAKLILLIVAGANTALFHLTIDRHRAEWDHLPIPPLQARIAGAVSLLLWFVIVAVGRLMAYTLV